jgi:hypothetical protein
VINDEEETGCCSWGDDWAEAHHDVELMDAAGRRLAKARLPEGVIGMARLHAMIGELGCDAEVAERRWDRDRLRSVGRGVDRGRVHGVRLGGAGRWFLACARFPCTCASVRVGVRVGRSRYPGRYGASGQDQRSTLASPVAG